MIHFGSYKLCDDSFSAATVLWNNSRKNYQLWSVSFLGNLECTDLNMEFCGLLPPAKISKARRSRPLRKPVPKPIAITPSAPESGKVDMKVIENLQTIRPVRGLQPQKRPPRVASKDETKWGAAAQDPLPDKWKPLSMSSGIIPGTTIKILVDTISKKNSQEFDKEGLLEWFSKKDINTCGDLAGAEKEVWNELKEIVPQSIYNSIEYMIEHVKKASVQVKKPLPPLPPPPPQQQQQPKSQPPPQQKSSSRAKKEEEKKKVDTKHQQPVAPKPAAPATPKQPEAKVAYKPAKSKMVDEIREIFPDCKVIERALEMTGYNQERAIEWILNNDLATGGDDAPAAPAAGGGGGGGGDGGVDGLVAQLQSLFSDVPKDKIRRALAQSGNNLEMAANIILGDF